jgi:hypothetical protein
MLRNVVDTDVDYQNLWNLAVDVAARDKLNHSLIIIKGKCSSGKSVVVEAIRKIVGDTGIFVIPREARDVKDLAMIPKERWEDSYLARGQEWWINEFPDESFFEKAHSFINRENTTPIIYQYIAELGPIKDEFSQRKRMPIIINTKITHDPLLTQGNYEDTLNKFNQEVKEYVKIRKAVRDVALFVTWGFKGICGKDISPLIGKRVYNTRREMEWCK